MYPNQTVYTSLLFSLALILFLPAVTGADLLTVEADILRFEEVVSIEVDEFVDLGNVTVGSETDHYKVNINNTGNVNVSVTPLLLNSSEVLFRNLFFTKRLSGVNFGWEPIGNFDFIIDTPSSSEGVEKDYFYMKLDLRNYTTPLLSNYFNHRTQLKFIAVAS